MRGDLETLYDAHAHRLYAHAWSLLGDQGAGDALKDTLIEAVRNPPRGETVLWLHHLTRTVCSKRGAFSRHRRPVFAQMATDPLLDAAGRLPADHREALLLSAGEWLEVRDIARVLRISQGGVHELLHEARTALERVVLDALMRGAADPAKHLDVIAAFEQGRLPHLLARRAPGFAPAPLREHVLAAADPQYDEVAAMPMAPAAPAAAPDLVVIGPDAGTDPKRERSRRRRDAVKGVGAVAGVAASVAVGLALTWPSSSDGTVDALGPNGSGTRPGPTDNTTTTDPGTPKPQGGGEQGAPDPRPTTQKRAPAAEEPSKPAGRATGLQQPPSSRTPSSPPSSAPPSDARETPPPSSQKPPQQDPGDDDGGSKKPNNPLEPVTDIVGGITSPILGGLGGQR